MKNAFIFSAGEYKDQSFYQKKLAENPDGDIIAVDGGLEIIEKLGKNPSVILGDFDSVNQDILKLYKEKPIKMLEYNSEKDQTDTELALDYLINEGYDSITIFGALGNRIDHALANIFLLGKSFKDGIDIKIISEDTEIFCLTGPVNQEFHFRVGDIVSLFPLGSEVTDLSLEGFKYKLDSQLLSNDNPTLCVSNVVKQKIQHITFKKGRLIVMVLKKA